MSENEVNPEEQADAVELPEASNSSTADPSEDQALAVDVSLLCSISSGKAVITLTHNS